MRVMISAIVACLIWFVAAQARADVEASCVANGFFTCISGSIGFAAGGSTTVGYLSNIDWDWNNDGTYEEQLSWSEENCNKSHQWASSGEFYVTVRVWNSVGEWDTITGGPFLVSEVTIDADPTSGQRTLYVDFSSTDGLPPSVDREYAWYFDWSPPYLPDWEDADSYEAAPQDVPFPMPMTYHVLLMIRYDNEDGPVCNDTVLIYVW